MEPKEILSCLIPCLLVIFTWQLEPCKVKSVIQLPNNLDLKFKFYLSVAFVIVTLILNLFLWCPYNGSLTV